MHKQMASWQQVNQIFLCSVTIIEGIDSK